VTRFSLTTAYALAYQRATILAGGTAVSTGNQYYGTPVLAFDSNNGYLGGSANNGPSARKYFIGAQLGYTGDRGNTVSEILSMIDADVAVDGTHPSGTFYFMNTTDPIRNVRSPGFQPAINLISAAGGAGEIINAVLPDGRT